DILVLYNKGIALSCLGKYDEAREAFDIVLSIKPDSIEVLNAKGVNLYNQGKFEDALKMYDKALELQPNHSFILENRQRALKRLN
ncbi:MAG TPA: tetratricopeptide repeat protein, partial [Nitrososphaeraceae archaeon]